MISDSTINDGPGGSRRAGSKHLPIAAQPIGEDWLSDSAEEVLAHLNSSATERGSSVTQTMAIPSVGGIVVGVLVTIFIAPCLFCAVEEWKWKRAQKGENGVGSHPWTDFGAPGS